MQYIKTNNGLDVPMLGYGVWRLEEGNQCYESVKMALATGYRHIDTAAIYGNEESVGRAIKDSGVPREDIFLTTKVWNEVQRTGVVADAFDESLKKLGVDYVDLYLVHWPVPGKYVDTYLELEKIYHTGRTKAIGVSNHHIHHLQELEKVWSVVPVMNQVEMHPYLSQEPLVSYCKEKKIIPESWSPLGAGKSDVLKNPILTEIGEKHGKSTAQVILRWNIERGVVTIPKSVTPSRIKENFDIFDFSLTAEEVTQINSLNTDTRTGASPDEFTF